jgi:hypothetical protein
MSMTQAVAEQVAEAVEPVVSPKPKSEKAEKPMQRHIVRVIWTGDVRGMMYDAEERRVSLDELEKLQPGTKATMTSPKPVHDPCMDDRYFTEVMADWQRRQAAPDATYPVLRCHGPTSMVAGYYIATGVDVQTRRLLRPTGGGVYEFPKGVKWSPEYETLAEAKAVLAEKEGQ